MVDNKTLRDKRLPVASIESVQLCLANAQRLLEDSKKTSEQTGMALLEISIEELMKGWMLMFLFIKNKYESIEDKKRKQLIEEYLNKQGLNLGAIENSFKSMGPDETTKFGNAIKNLFEPPVYDAFERHNIKLDYLANLLEYLKYWIPIARKDMDTEVALKAIDQIMGGYAKIRITKEELDAKIEEILQHLIAFNINFMKNLKEVKEKNLYVNLENSILISPIVDISESEELKWLAELLQEYLIIEINMAKS